MTLNKKTVEICLNAGYILVVNDFDWKITIADPDDLEYIGTVRFDTYLKMDLKNFERQPNIFWSKKYKLKEGYSIWK